MPRRRITVHVLGVCACAVLVAGSAPASQLAPVSTAAPTVDTVLAASTVSTGPPGSAPSNTCSSNAISAKIGGQRTCLSAGQHCQRPRAAEYGHFGFSCQKSGTQYRLLTKSAPGTSHALRPHR